ncbi:MASE1 domain-containing protein [Erwiniaceae bacterium BAC15a-03b]|uniref:MASE1 domain-containing protein n=1 Tax=Winslowiella arboricola TaxID=2978220 RepID=A0A9J6PKT5_9GAMM|nr:MASE1 domain-containing protein [Winslowiella arboricola]MCU5774612.1 MASE1 domain-containing protein [Winslowiella arboricola]MCU5777978.1 MASE1 domain-containing protein [Winslowiella arboricola]
MPQRRHLVLSLFLALFFALSWLALWTISFYLSQNGQQAVLLLPQGLHLALMILLPRRYWLALLLVEGIMISALQWQHLLARDWVLLSPLISLLPAWLSQRVWHRHTLYWQRLTVLLAAVSANTLLQGVLIGPWLNDGMTQTMLASFTGGILLTPFSYLIYEYLRQQHLSDMLAQRMPDPPLRTSLLIWCSVFFAIGVSIQVAIAPEMERLLLMLVFLPNVFMAYKFGWQGGVLSAILGSVLITLTRQASGAFHDLRELELFLSTQALLGTGLGIAVSRQQQLAQHLQRYRLQLEKELQARRQLMTQLVDTEEAVRKAIARELHDEIGQNITAIQIQAMLVNRTADSAAVQQAAGQIGDLSKRIHHTTRQLLRQLRPPVLEEMALDKALHQLAGEFSFAEQGIDFQLDYQLTSLPQDETLIFTLYRVVQELLNNISKHAQARQVKVSLVQHQRLITLTVSDDGIGMSVKGTGGFGLRGIEERVRALGGDWQMSQQQGTRIIVNLPTKLDQISP